MPDQSYPIIEQRMLPPATRTWLGRRRDLTQLPEQPPGCVMVFTVNGRYETVKAGTRLDGRSEVVVDAASVSVVDAGTDHLVEVPVELPSADPAEPFQLVVTFSCTVREPADVVRSRVHLPGLLGRYVRAEAGMRGQLYQPDEVGFLRQTVAAQIEAACEIRPPVVAGMRVEFAAVEVRTADSLMLHLKDMNAERRRQALKQLSRTFTTEQAAVFEAIRQRGPEAVEALAVELGQISEAAVAERAYDLRYRTRRMEYESLQVFAERGHLDRVPVDGLIERLLGSLVGSNGSGSPDAAAKGPAPVEGSVQAQITPAAEDEPLDEDDT
jgi:hypothetical protein